MNYRTILAGTTALISVSEPSFAGEEVLYAAAPDWVQEASIDLASAEQGPSTLVADWQHRIEGGVVTSYFDSALRIATPQDLNQQGTITFTWLPDKGDLTVHRAAIIRGGETIDLIADGETFDVLRRERGLERRLIDGQLTATLAVPGLQVGDILRVTHSRTVNDQALGEDVQVQQFLPTEPWKAAQARTVVSWPSNRAVRWDVEDGIEIADPVERDGYTWLTLDLPLAEREKMPFDAPWRYRRPAILRVGTFENWPYLSQLMYPHFAEAARVDRGSAVADQASAIMQRHSDPLDRMAAAVRLVQDEISYLMNGLEGGNYLPQSASETWELRYGDCKAKSVLLHALLQEMGIESETVLVHSRLGDAAPELLPVPGVFDHMIVRASVNGIDYWLDGTSSAMRRHSLTDVPPFHYALPLRSDGAELVAMTQREKAWPDSVTTVVSDYSAGLDLPAPFELTVTMSGPRSDYMRKAVDENDIDALRNMAKSIGRRAGRSGTAVSSIELDYDDDLATGTAVVRGIAGSEFEWDDGQLVFDAKLVPPIRFRPDRAKREWREIPVQTRGPSRNHIERTLILPEANGGYSFEGFDSIDENVANTRIVGSAGLTGNRFHAAVQQIAILGEIAPDRIAATKREARRVGNIETKVIAPDDVRWRWQYGDAELKRRIAPLVESYGKAMEFADEDDYSALTARANLYGLTYQWDQAKADLDTLIEKDASQRLMRQRANVHQAMGNDDAAIADLEVAYDLDPDTRVATNLAILMAYNDRVDEALDLIDSLPVNKQDNGSIANARATTLGLAGRADEALDALADAVDEEPNDPMTLNSDCWFRGLFDVALEDALAICTKGIEKADDNPAILDSRGMVHFRLGDMEAALADFDAALEINPSIAASRYMRGIVLLELGREEGRAQVEQALRMSPQLERTYARHGIAPPN